MKKLTPVVEKHCKLILWMLPKIANFPKDQRFLLADRIEQILLDILELLNVRRFRKRLKRFSGEWRVISGEKKPFTNHSSLATRHCDSVRCWVAHSKYANTAKLRLRIWRDLKEVDDCFAETIRGVLQ